MWKSVSHGKIWHDETESRRKDGTSFWVETTTVPFLNDKDDVRSSYCLEEVATEFQVQGLELDWACVVWDADFRYRDDGRKN